MNDRRSLQINFTVGVLASLVAGWLAATASWLISESWSAVAIVGLAWTVILLAIAYAVRRAFLTLREEHERALLVASEPSLSSVTFERRMSDEEAVKRIRSAKSEIWSFQISGGEFTASSTETYEAWLSKDRNRTLLIAFANPENTGLLKNIVKLSGQHKESDEDHAYEHLRLVIETTLNKYVDLQKRFPGQVTVRVYDFSPPYSFHAVDPDNPEMGSGLVELYLPDLSSADRPCMRLPHGHVQYSLYKAKSLAWFEDSSDAPQADAEPDLTTS